MSLLRRILRSQNLRPLFSTRQITSSAAVPYPHPLGRRDPYSLPLALTQKIDPECHIFDERPISLRYRVATALELSDLDRAAEISRYAVLDIFRTNAVVPCNAIIDAMCRAKRYEDAIALFHYFFNKSNIVPNTLSFNLIIKAHCDEGHVDDALELYRHFTAFSAPDSDTHRLLAQGMVDSGRIDEAVCLAASVGGVDWKVHDVLIRGLLNSGNHDRAHELFRQVKSACDADGIAFVNSTFMDYRFEQGEDEKKALVNLPVKLELLSGNKLLQVLFKHGQTRIGWAYFKDMLREGIFDSETINIGVNEYFKQGEFIEALETFKRSPPGIMSGCCNGLGGRVFTCGNDLT